MSSESARRARRSPVVSTLVVSAALALAGCTGSPRLASEKSRTAADALYTAVTSQRVELLDATEATIAELQRGGELSAEDFDELRAVIAQARSGAWRAAAERLDRLIRSGG
ncbi:MAG: hypothetical protein KF774_20685 [Planctomyces sp.]|nr:hypothetical protein [Planctomyces sp.]